MIRKEGDNKCVVLSTHRVISLLLEAALLPHGTDKISLFSANITDDGRDGNKNSCFALLIIASRR